MSENALDILREAQGGAAPTKAADSMVVGCVRVPFPADEKPPEEKHGALAPVAQQKAAHALAPPSYAMPRTVAELKTLGEMLYASGMFKDVKNVAQACVKIAAGAALGYDPVASMGAFHMFDGKISPTSGEITARIQRSGRYRLKWWFIDAVGERHDPIKQKPENINACVMQVYEKWGEEWEPLEPVVFSKQDAINAGLMSKDNWKKYSSNMLFARALTNAARWHCAVVFGGAVYTPEELGAAVTFDADGEMVVATVGDTPPEPERKPLTAPALKVLYAEARAANPALPAVSLKEWARGVEGYDPDAESRMTVKQALAIEDALRTAIAAVSQASKHAEKVAAAAQAEPDAIAASRPVEETAPATAQETALVPPPGGGAPMTPETNRGLFAALRSLGIGEGLDSTKEGKAESKRLRLVWAQSFEGSLSKLSSFTELDDEQGRWLTARANDDRREAQRMASASDGKYHGDGQCPGCNAFPDNEHAAGCPERDLAPE